LLDRYTTLTQQLAEDYSDAALEEMGRLQEQLDSRNAWDLDSRLKQALDALRCPPGDAEVSSLSGGERRRVALCALLLQQPDLLLLDEPTNHLDAESAQWLEQHLEKYPGTVVAVTHDRYFLDHVAGWILELDRGHAYPYEGNYSTYLETKQTRLTVEGRKDAKLRRRLAQELEWVRAGAKARQTKSRSRLQRYEQMVAQAQRRRTVDLEEIQIPTGPRLGNLVVEAHALSKSYGDRVLFHDLSFSLPRNGIVGVLGPNGVGKTTLFRMLVGQEQPDGGQLRIGDTVRLSYVDQNREQVDPDRTAWEVVSEGHDFLTIGQIDVPSRAYLAAFGFKGADQQKPARLFSGGQRNRLNLALTLKQGGNVLLLDEPTNDLDVETLSSLESALLDFPGCAVITSHDRWFLDRVATHILAWEGTGDDPGRWFWFEGNFDGYENTKLQRLGAEAVRPHRITHRKLTRE
ncbi:MAG TPA: energy-dependent translational throttle protein EttA, partial [Pseudonocardiaceae bacterium]|nr:energy-dependent translational throttle protein EttA [Pseudonocardiaceae bacterium]